MKYTFALVLSLILLLSFTGCGQNEYAAPRELWGITLEAEEITPAGMVLVCHQSGGENVYDLNTGSFYGIQKLKQGQWSDIDPLPQEYEVAWTSEAWIIEKGGTTRWNIQLGWLYGALPAGEYRIVKPITNFKGTGDFETRPYYAEFIIE